MDKAQLLEYYSTHYFSRQEILFKLPFSISAESFWQEVVNRRKMRAAILPLCNAQGKPYWYVMTDKMVKASEVLCEEAMAHEEADPYRMEMTIAMTWEMFFTSFVEGVQMDMDKALDYLSCDTEPSDAQEQLLWNNRQAISLMASSVFRPVNEELMLHLAYLLTQDLDNTADLYRQTDIHPIAAMQGENYLVPSASDIPILMNELYAFLNKSDVHPLIKAAVSQAFILTTRPFPDGNERLSRIISALILYRSGYDYFRDISLSRKIAKESYRYYKNMRELLNPESDADMTCFVEYYIDLLARALTEAKEEKTRQENFTTENTISEERKMSAVPFAASRQEEAESTAIDVGDILSGAEPVTLHQHEAKEKQSRPASESKTASEADFSCIMTSFCESRSADVRRMGALAKRLWEQGVIHFTTEQWAEYGQLDLNKAKTDCYYMRKRGLLINRGNISTADYYFRTDGMDSESAETAEEEPVLVTETASEETKPDTDLSAAILKMQGSVNIREKRFAQTLAALADNGQISFTSADWAHTGGISPATAEKDLRDVIGMGLVYRTGDVTQYVYHIGKSPDGNSGMQISKTQRDILNRLRKVFQGQFTAKQAAEKLNINRNTLIYHLKYLTIGGEIACLPSSYPPTYEINSTVDESEAGSINSVPEIIALQPQIKVAAGLERASAWA